MDAVETARASPAYLTYACDDLATDSYYALTLSERGLLDAMRRACWASADLGVPADPVALSAAVRCAEADVRAALTPAVLKWFTASAGRLYEPDLQRQYADWLAKVDAPNE